MNGLDNHYANMLADHERMLDEQAQKEEEMDSFKDKIALLLEENHPAELERLTGVDDTTCKKVVHQLYMEGFKNIPDHNLFASCIDKGIFLMEE